jgi:hypothetical protein
MEKIDVKDNSLLNKIDSEEIKPVINKAKKKKKKSKKQKEKKCAGLKELLEQIKEEKLEKIRKEQEKERIQNESNTKSQINLTKSENEDKNKDCSVKDYINIFNNSVSGTTTATLSLDDFNEFQKLNFDKSSENSNRFEYSELKPNYLMKNSENSEDEKIDDEQYFKKRKISSPICDYYEGFDKFLSETHKGSVDLTNSMNFIKKEDFISSNRFINNSTYNNDINYYINPEVNNYKNNIDFENNNNNLEEYNKDKNNIEIENNNDNKELIKLDIDKDNINIYNEECEECDYVNIPYSQFIDYYNYIMPETGCRSKFNFINSIYKPFYANHANKREKKNYKNNGYYYHNKKDFSKISKEGDWICNICRNLNFSFRTFCNRCNSLKQ